ncbi:Ig-like domain-containing protein [Oceanirhabdus seepicola]|uniref:SbsA Ig-like domain-containing protein n=1 Tax=Oceanirhabdus seepicola TaxID=2828781 RepID=A0A9J6P1J5_9CLOT|nr:hypothetical protein [Oceanirhabdus seepicola]
MKKERILKLFIVFSILIGLVSSNTVSVFADSDDNKWDLDVREEVQLPNKEWSIVFSTGLDKQTINNKNIYVLDSKDKKVSNIKLKYIEEEKTLKIIPGKEYEQGKSYFLCLDEGLKSHQGKPLSKPYKLQFEIKKVDSDFFKIRNIEVVSKNRLNVYFTQPINEGAELPLYYEILRDGYEFIRGSYQTMDVKRVDGSNNEISIYLKEHVFNSNEEYTIKVLGDLMSDYGVRLLNGLGEQMIFEGIDSENEDIKIDDVETLSETIVKINFNKAFDKNTAGEKKNYLLLDSNDNPITITKINLSDDLKSVELTIYPKLKSSEEYELTVKGINDNFNLSKLKSEKREVYWYGGTKINLDITYVEPVNRRVINVYFNKPIDKISALKTSYYQIRDISSKRLYTSPIRVSYDSEKDPFMVKLYLKDEVRENKIYNLNVSKYMKDEMGNSYSNASDCEFQGSNVNYQGVYVKDAVVIGNDHIKVAFSGEIRNSGVNLETANYLLECSQGENRKILIGCSSVRYVDGSTLILTFEGLNYNEDYVLKINSLEDILGERTDIYADGVDVILGQ